MRFSTLFGRTRTTSGTTDCTSHDLLVRAGYIRAHAAGIYSYLNLGLRSLRRIEAVIRLEMDALGYSEILMSGLQDADIWRATGRYESIDATLMRLTDRRGHDYVLGMTHEEMVSTLAATELASYRQLDTVVYQIQTKIRDETRSRGGLLRTREFLMKDAYSFHTDQAGLDRTYAEMAGAYHRIFRTLGLADVVQVESDTGLMGGARADEFMAYLDIGDDTVATCASCGHAVNREVIGSEASCARCGGALESRRGVEVGNIFQLGTRYSDAAGVAVLNRSGARQSVLMGSYGIGVSRLLAVLVERFHDERGIAMTARTAALDAHLMVLGRDDGTLATEATRIMGELTRAGLAVIWDDRSEQSAGVMLRDADLMGGTIRVTLGRDTRRDGTVELRERRSGACHTVSLATAGDAIQRLHTNILRREGT